MKKKYFSLLKKEIARIDKSGTTKRKEVVIEKFLHVKNRAPFAIVNNEKYMVFNSNDYLGLRLHPKLKDAESVATKKFGVGPGAVRFISGTLLVHKKLEKKLAQFHNREDAMICSSTFAVNFGVLHALIKGQSRDSLATKKTLVISDQLNHRSIIDGIRVANLPKEERVVFKHIDMNDLEIVLKKYSKKFDRVLIITDGVFSMVGEFQNLKSIVRLAKKYDKHFSYGILTVVDDAHGVASAGKTGRGTEEVCKATCDVLISTLGKGFGVDGGYVVSNKVVIDYLRESTATYIYSNPIGPGTAAAALKSLQVVDSLEGKKLLAQLHNNIQYFKEKVNKTNLAFVTDSNHAVQPILIGDSVKTKKLVDKLFEKGIIVTNISYPVVPKGKDEIRVQLSASHTKKDIDILVFEMEKGASELGLL